LVKKSVFKRNRHYLEQIIRKLRTGAQLLG
jgi:hypothetical protein